MLEEQPGEGFVYRRANRSKRGLEGAFARAPNRARWSSGLRAASSKTEIHRQLTNSRLSRSLLDRLALAGLWISPVDVESIYIFFPSLLKTGTEDVLPAGFFALRAHPRVI